MESWGKRAKRQVIKRSFSMSFFPSQEPGTPANAATKNGVSPQTGRAAENGEKDGRLVVLEISFC